LSTLHVIVGYSSVISASRYNPDEIDIANIIIDMQLVI
jgi:hypothetical protein